MPNFKQIDLSVQSYKGSQNFEIGHVTLATPTKDHSVVHTHEGLILYVFTKFETDISIHSKVMKGPKILKLCHVTPDLATFNLKR